MVGEGLNKRFANTYTFSNNDINKFVLLLRKGVYLYENITCKERWKIILLQITCMQENSLERF